MIPANIDSPQRLNQQTLTTVLPTHHITHHPSAGINPLVDAASFLFSLLGKLKPLITYANLNQLHQELLQEIKIFEEQVQTRGYNPEYIIVCRYLLAATFDDVISHTAWGANGQWETYSLLAAYQQDINHQEKFFTIMERALKDPNHYIDLLEVMYLCLSLGYKGQYRATEYNQYQLEQITNNLYQHIRAYRGTISKQLSAPAIKSRKTPTKPLLRHKPNWLFIFLVTACIIMIIFISLSYVMDIKTDEAYQAIFPMETTT